MYKSEEEHEYTISDIKKELYKLNQNFENLVKFIIDKHNINLNTELELYKILIENIQNECKHNSVFILECPKIRGNYIHQSHNSNCKTCYNIECNDCKKILQCKSCYNNKETCDDYFSDLDKKSDDYGKCYVPDEYKNRNCQEKYCDKCKRISKYYKEI